LHWRIRETGQQQCHIQPMSNKETHPYTLEVMPSKTKPGQFEWAIRERGKLIQRSDRLLGSEQAARKAAWRRLTVSFKAEMSVDDSRSTGPQTLAKVKAPSGQSKLMFGGSLHSLRGQGRTT
jgi:hypothetical protein